VESEQRLSVCLRSEDIQKRLNSLKEQLYKGNVSRARKAAHVLSYMQEDGLAILKEVLFDNNPKSLKTAAAYGLRSMRGRMKTLGLEAIKEGLLTHNHRTRETCKKTLLFLCSREQATSKPAVKPPQKIKIKEISPLGKKLFQTKATTHQHL
jgi:hypothetical protein